MIPTTRAEKRSPPVEIQWLHSDKTVALKHHRLHRWKQFRMTSAAFAAA
jgi:hypothetical protein